jgi:glycolate oxidase FAD binding subunit
MAAPATTPSSLLPLRETRRVSAADQAAGIIRQAYETATPVYPIGGGTSLGLGLVPTDPGIGLDLAGLNGVIDYPARDLTVTVEAGMTMAALAELLAGERQRLPVDVPQADRATLGGVIATNFNGPRRYGEGSLRDYVIGIAAIDGRGNLFHGGGRVVKNVAGYDFCKLLTGSLGSLGVVTQVTLKLKPIPEQSALVACAVRDEPEAERLLAALITSRTRPVAIELLAGPAWEREASLAALAPPFEKPLFLVVGLEGSSREVEAMTRQLLAEWRSQGVEQPLVIGEAANLWKRLVEFPAEGESPLVLRFSVVPSGTTAIVAAVRQLDPACSIQAHAGNGSVLVQFSQIPAQGLTRSLVGTLQPLAAAHRGYVVTLANPGRIEMTHQSVWGATDLPLTLMAEVKRQFDPRNILNRGRFVV